MAEPPVGYNAVPEEDRKKAKVFFGHGETQAATGQYEYAMSMFLDGLRHDPDAVDAHHKLREISLKRKASGGKPLGMFEARKFKTNTKNDKDNLLNAERLLAYDPGNVSHMLTLAQSAAKAGYFDTVNWIGPQVAEAEASSPKPDANIFLALRDVFKMVQNWKLALECLYIAMRFKPNNMELQVEARNLAAQQTMKGAGYDKAGSFRDSVRDMDSQLRLLDADKEVADADVLGASIAEAQRQMEADPTEPGKALKLVDLLVKTDQPALEDRAVTILQDWFDKTRQFRFRQNIGKIRIKQMQRQERLKRKAAEANPELKKEWLDFQRQQAEFELSEYTLMAQAYPTDLVFRFEIGKRQFILHQFDEAIGSFQTARNDPKQRVDALILLARSFLEAGFLDEADDTLGALIRDFPNRESSKFMDMNYWRGRVFEKKGMIEEARKHFSTVLQIDSAYKDVSARIKRLRDVAAAPPQPAPEGEEDQ